MDETPIAFDCPHCGQGYTIEASDALYANNIEDGNDSQCETCKEWYQVKCVWVEIELEATKSVRQHKKAGSE